MNLARLLSFTPFRGKLRGPEDAISLEVGSQLRAWALEGRLRATFCCVPHESGAVSPKSPEFKRAQARIAKAVAQGMVTGSGDYVFVSSDGGGWIEIKSLTGSLSPAQRDFRDWCFDVGVKHAVCRSLDEVKTVLIEWGMLRL